MTTFPKRELGNVLEIMFLRENPTQGARTYSDRLSSFGRVYRKDAAHQKRRGGIAAPPIANFSRRLL